MRRSVRRVDESRFESFRPFLRNLQGKGYGVGKGAVGDEDIEGRSHPFQRADEGVGDGNVGNVVGLVIGDIRCLKPQGDGVAVGPD